MSDTTQIIVAHPDVRIEFLPSIQMVTLRGELESSDIRSAVHTVLGATLPSAGNIQFGSAGDVAWMSPDELLLMPGIASAGAIVDRLGDSLAGLHTLALDVSDARVVFSIKGPSARDVLAKGAPIDLDPDRFGTGNFRRTRLGQIAVAIWCVAPEDFRLVCFRSLAGAVTDWLENAGREGSMPRVFLTS